jgi:glycosyltransferase involved in cell wall biosynthesis
MRIFTCTPVAFGGGADFFARDSGLLCRGLQSIGVESRAVMPGERKPEDEADLIRTDYRNLESAEWWRTHKLDGVVLYAWGRPKFRKVAAAIREAGVFLILNQDSAGLMSTRVGRRDWLEAQWVYGGQGRGAAAWIRTAKLVFRGMTVELLVSDPLRGAHLKQGHVIGCVSPMAAERYRKLCRAHGGEDLASRVEVIPHAVESRFRHSGQAKRRQIACVGRWQDVVQKRPWLLMDVAARVLSNDPELTVVIAGRSTSEMRQWHAAQASECRDRVRLAGMMDRDELAALFAESQVFYSPSAYESFGIAAAEALCAGCSVVAARKVTMPSFEWFVSENSGRLADRDDAEGHTALLLAELAAWENGERDAAEISRVWCERLHADKVAARVVEMADGKRMKG